MGRSRNAAAQLRRAKLLVVAILEDGCCGLLSAGSATPLGCQCGLDHWRTSA
jgi:hypothetical protein